MSFVGVALALETKHPMFASCASAANNLRNVELEFSDVHQGDIDKLRHPDRGSSCCGRFVASLIQQFLANPMPLQTSFTLLQLKESCLRAVRAQDAALQCNGADLLARMLPPQTPLQVAFLSSDRELANWMHQQSPPFAMAVTAVPQGLELVHDIVGDTFAVLVTNEACLVVDSHNHNLQSDTQAGLVRALIIGPDFMARAAARIYGRGG